MTDTLSAAIARAHPADDPVVKLREIADRLQRGVMDGPAEYRLGKWLGDWLDRYTAEVMTTPRERHEASEATIVVTDAPKWLLWSTLHLAWWAPKREGYAVKVAEAGRYTADEAVDVIQNSLPPGRTHPVAEEHASDDRWPGCEAGAFPI